MRDFQSNDFINCLSNWYEYLKTPKGKEVHSKAVKKWRSKYRRLKFNDGKIHYVPLEKAKEFENLKSYQRIYTK